MTWLVVGLGSAGRGDDAVGPIVASGVAGLGLPCVDVIAHADPTGLIETWSAYTAVVVVDAVRTGKAPGTVLVLEAGAEVGVLAEHDWNRSGRGGTQVLGLASAIELGRALGMVPERLVLVGVEAERTDPGAGMSPRVLAALDRVQEVVVRLVAQPAPAAPAPPAVPAAPTAPAVPAARPDDVRRAVASESVLG